jgi:hypothetical protein
MANERPDPEALYERLCAENKSDGLPVIPPTADRLDDTLAHTPRPADEVVMRIPTSSNELTVRSLASCAVMAGCRPEYFPVVLAAFDAMAEWDNLRAVMSTTGGYDVAMVVNGPVRDELNINCGRGLYGPGYRANATIGRAKSLAFLTVGGVHPEQGTMASQTHQGRFTYCFGEREAATDWDPLHADVGGLDPEESAVTVFTAHAPLITAEGWHGDPPTAGDVVESVAHDGAHGGAAPAAVPGEVAFVLGEDHAQLLADHMTKGEVKEAFYEHCRLPYSERPLLTGPEDALVIPAGGQGNISSIIHTMSHADNDPVTKPVPADPVA